MTQMAEQIRSQMTQLSSDEQAQLLTYLLRLVDGESHDDAQDAWRDEIVRRTDDVISGRDKGIDADAAHKWVRDRLENGS